MSLIESLCEWITPTTVAIYIIIHVLTYVVCISIQSKHIMNADPELNKRFPCFARSDTHRWSIIKMFPCKNFLNLHIKYLHYSSSLCSLHSILAKIFDYLCDNYNLYSLGLVWYLPLLFIKTLFRIIMIGHEAGKPLHPIRRILTKKPGQWLPRLLILFCHVYWIKVERP